MPFAIPRILLEVGMSQVLFQFLLAFLHICAMRWMLLLQGGQIEKITLTLWLNMEDSLSLSLPVIQKFLSLLVFSVSH